MEYVIDTAITGCEGYCPARERVIRCRDCKHMEPLYNSTVHCDWFPDGVGACMKWMNYNCEVDGFCAWGERRE